MSGAAHTFQSVVTGHLAKHSHASPYAKPLAVVPLHQRPLLKQSARRVCVTYAEFVAQCHGKLVMSQPTWPGMHGCHDECMPWTPRQRHWDGASIWDQPDLRATTRELQRRSSVAPAQVGLLECQACHVVPASQHL